MDIEHIGDRVRKLRKGATPPLTQQELADKVGNLSFQNIGNLEQGKIKQAPNYVEKLAQVLNVTVDYLIRGDMASYQITDEVHELLATDRPTDIDFTRSVYVISVPATETPILPANALMHGKIIKRFK
tara:strand:+ start:615 stop:998 length:384 start_codon:yes stop_codon:yes gene_type:complete